jgi:hypothetical protein
MSIPPAWLRCLDFCEKDPGPVQRRPAVFPSHYFGKAHSRIVLS